MDIIRHIKANNQPLINRFLERWKKDFAQQVIRIYHCENEHINQSYKKTFTIFKEKVLDGEPLQNFQSDQAVAEHLQVLADRNLILLLVKKSHSLTLDYLYKKCRNMMLYRATNKYYTTKENGEDAFQETFVAFHQNVLNGTLVELTTDLKWYLCRIFHNKIVNILKKNDSKNKSLDSSNVDLHVALNNIEASIEDEDVKQQVELLLRQLDPECRELLVLFYFKKYDMDSIARVLNYLNANSAKTKKYKCLQKLIRLINNT